MTEDEFQQVERAMARHEQDQSFLLEPELLGILGADRTSKFVVALRVGEKIQFEKRRCG